MPKSTPKRKPNVDVMGDACEKIGIKLTYPQKQKLCNLAIDVVARRIAILGFKPERPMGYLTRLIQSLDSLLLFSDDKTYDHQKTLDRRGEIKQKKDRGLTRLTFKKE